MVSPLLSRGLCFTVHDFSFSPLHVSIFYSCLGVYQMTLLALLANEKAFHPQCQIPFQDFIISKNTRMAWHTLDHKLIYLHKTIDLVSSHKTMEIASRLMQLKSA